MLNLLGNIPSSDFEAVDQSPLMLDPDSAQMKGATLGTPPLNAPVEGATGVSLTPSLRWRQPSGAVSGSRQYTADVWDPTVNATTFQYTAARLTAAVRGGGRVAGHFDLWALRACDSGGCDAVARGIGVTA